MEVNSMGDLVNTFRKKVKESLLDKKNFKNGTVIVDADDKYDMWDIYYKGVHFVLEFWEHQNEDYVWALFNAQNVEMYDMQDIDVCSYGYQIDDFLIQNEEDIDSFIEEVIDCLKNCYIAKNINKICNSVEKLVNMVKNLDGYGNEDVLSQVLRSYDLY